jgi:hypothetical protein
MGYAEFILVPKSEQARLVAMLKQYQQLQQARLDEQAREAWEKNRCVVSGPFLAGRGPLEFNASWVEWPGMGIQTPDMALTSDGPELCYRDGA